jgi:hypothetical protein
MKYGCYTLNTLNDYVGRIWEFLANRNRAFILIVKSLYNAFRGVYWKILRLSKVLLQFMEKGGDDCFEVILDFADKLS